MLVRESQQADSADEGILTNIVETSVIQRLPAAAHSSAVADRGVIRSCRRAIQVRVPKLAATSAGPCRSTPRAGQSRLDPMPSPSTWVKPSSPTPCTSCTASEELDKVGIDCYCNNDLAVHLERSNVIAAAAGNFVDIG